MLARWISQIIDNSIMSLEITDIIDKLKQKDRTFSTRKAEVLNSLIMKITANENDINDILQTFR